MGRVTIDLSLRPPAWIFIGQPVSFGRTSDIDSRPRLQPIFEAIRSPLTFWRSDTPLFPIFNCQRLHATIDRPFHPSACRNELYTGNPAWPPLRALLIPHGALFPCTQNALLRVVAVRITDIIRGCKLSRKDRSWYQSNYEECFSRLCYKTRGSSENSVKIYTLFINKSRYWADVGFRILRCNRAKIVAELLVASRLRVGSLIRTSFQRLPVTPVHLLVRLFVRHSWHEYRELLLPGRHWLTWKVSYLCLNSS